MNWISHWKKIGIKVKQILKKQPIGQQETDWKSCPQCKKISYLPDLMVVFLKFVLPLFQFFSSVLSNS